MDDATVLAPGASAAAVRHHYDVGNEFYRLWLDPDLHYSAGVWETDDTLETAQIRKLELHIAQARASGRERVLDVGCGWGVMLRRLVGAHGVRHAVGLTLSKAQADWIAAYGEPRIEVRVENWADHVPAFPYDAIVSSGAFEHFARPDLSEAERVDGYRRFFQRCHEWLVPGGWLSLETIVYERARRQELSRFFVAEIYPESDLPTLGEIARGGERLFEVVTLRNDRQDAERTWRAWLTRLKASRAAAIDLVGEEMVARYEKYLHLSIIGFHLANMGQLRIAMRRIDEPRA